MASESNIGKRRVAAKKDSSASYVARRREIADAAVRVFHRVGLERASMSAVAEELGIDRASLYYYASSKEVLFDEAVRAVVQRNLEMVQSIQASAVNPQRKLRDLIIALMTSYGEHYPVFYIYIRENLSQVDELRAEWSRDMRELNRATVNSVIAIVEQGYNDGTLRNIGPARIVAYGILGIVGWTHRWFRPEQSREGANEIGKTYAELLLGGLMSLYSPSSAADEV